MQTLGSKTDVGGARGATRAWGMWLALRMAETEAGIESSREQARRGLIAVATARGLN